jgi:Fe-S-cluster containining protein
MTTGHTKKIFDTHNEVFLLFKDRLRQIYDRMDAQYAKASQSYGFECTGCRESCCETLFYHHTFSEYLYLLDGFFSLEPELQAAIRQKARTGRLEQTKPDAGVMCPLNRDGLCLSYAHRPMICRLHGIPHELQKPGQAVSRGPGCGVFTRQCENMAYKKFDRTPFYREMALLEKDLRQSAGLNGKIKMTVAQMLMNGEDIIL